MRALNYIKNNIGTFVENLIVATVIIFIGLIIAKAVRNFVYRVLKEIEINRVIEKLGKKFDIEQFVSKLLYYIIILVTIVMALQQVGLATTVLNIVIVGFAILFIFIAVVWLKYFIPNAFARIMLYKSAEFKEGDYINITELNIEGKVEIIRLTETKILNKNGEGIYIPNSSMYRSTIKKK